jgi:hypothetical protein
MTTGPSSQLRSPAAEPVSDRGGVNLTVNLVAGRATFNLTPVHTKSSYIYYPRGITATNLTLSTVIIQSTKVLAARRAGCLFGTCE